MEPSIAAPNRGSFNIHTIHWSTIALGAAAAVALVALVAGIALSQMPLMVLGGVYFVICGVGAYYTHTFSEYKTLESHNILLRQQINELAQTALVAQDGNERLKEEGEKLKHLLQQNETLRKAHEEALKSERENMKEQLDKLDKINRKLEKDGKKVEKEMVELSRKFETTTTDLQSSIETDKKNIMDLEVTVATLKAQITRLQNEVDEQQELVVQYDRQNKSFDALNKQLEEQITTLKSASNSKYFHPDKLKKITEGANDLAEQTRKLNEGTEARSQRNKEVEQIITKLLSRIHKLEAALIELDKKKQEVPA